MDTRATNSRFLKPKAADLQTALVCATALHDALGEAN